MTDVFSDTGYQSTRRTPEEDDLTAKASAAARRALADVSIAGVQAADTIPTDGQLSFDDALDTDRSAIPEEVRNLVDQHRAKVKEGHQTVTESGNSIGRDRVLDKDAKQYWASQQ